MTMTMTVAADVAGAVAAVVFWRSHWCRNAQIQEPWKETTSKGANEQISEKKKDVMPCHAML
jgi:hypothetical protein